MCASHIWFPTPTPGRVGISPDVQSLPRDCKSFFSPPLEEHRQVSSDLGTASTSMNLPPGFPGGGRDTKYLKHTSFTYIMYIDGWKGPFPWPAHPALICRNRYYVSIHHNSSIPKQKMCFRKRKKIPGNFLESSGCSRNYSKMVLLDSSTNSTLFWGQNCQNLMHRTDFMTKVDRKQISVYLETLISSQLTNFQPFLMFFFLKHNVLRWGFQWA